MSTPRWLTSSLLLAALALTACSAPAPSVSDAPVASASASAAPAETPAESRAAAVLPGAAGAMQAHLESEGATCGLAEETADGYRLMCGFEDAPVEYTFQFNAASDGSFEQMNILMLDMGLNEFAEVTPTRMQNTVLLFINPLIGQGNGPTMFAALADYWSYAGTGISITPAGSPVEITFDEPGELMPADSTISLTVTPAESAAPAAGGEEGFAFPFAEVLEYYQSEDFVCGDEQLDIVEDHTWISCAALVGDVRHIVVLTANGAGELVDGIGRVTSNDETLPSVEDARSHLRGFVGAMLGSANGNPAADWVEEQLGSESEAVYGGLEIMTSTQSDSLVIEIATPEYAAAYEAADNQ